MDVGFWTADTSNNGLALTDIDQDRVNGAVAVHDAVAYGTSIFEESGTLTLADRGKMVWEQAGLSRTPAETSPWWRSSIRPFRAVMGSSRFSPKSSTWPATDPQTGGPGSFGSGPSRPTYGHSNDHDDGPQSLQDVSNTAAGSSAAATSFPSCTTTRLVRPSSRLRSTHVAPSSSSRRASGWRPPSTLSTRADAAGRDAHHVPV